MADVNSRRFLMYTGLALAGGPMALLFWPDGWLVFTAVLSILGGLYGLMYLLATPVARINFLLMASVVIVLMSAAGLLFSFVTISWVDYDIWMLFLEYTHITPPDLALAQGVANGFAMVLWLLGSHVQRSGKLDSIYQRMRYGLYHQTRAVLALALTIITCQLYLLNGAVIVYGGKDLANEAAPVHPLLALIIPLVPVLPFGLAYILRGYFRQRRWLPGLVLVVLLLGELYWFFLFGRRSVVYYFVLLLAGFSFGSVLTVRDIIRNIVPLGLSVFLMLTVADTYHKMRTVYGFNALQRMNLAETVRDVQAVDSDRYGNIRKMNMAVRSSYSSLAVARFVNVFRTTHDQPLAGQVLGRSFLLATPSDFLVDKAEVLAKELLYEQAYALSLTDISETLYLEAFIDFGWLGCFLYPALLFGLFYGLCAVARWSQSPIGCLMVSCGGIWLALTMMETDLISFLAALRALFVYGIMARLLRVGRGFSRAETPVMP